MLEYEFEEVACDEVCGLYMRETAAHQEAILRRALDRNPAVRIVATAVTLETLAEAARCFALLGLTDTDMVQIAATRVKRAGGYHLMDAQNPVWILTGETARHPTGGGL